MMRHRHFYNWYAGCLLASSVGLTLAARAQDDSFGGDPSTNAFIRIPSDTDDWTRHFRLGAMVGMNISGSFAMKGNFGVSGNNIAAGTFDDGYVHQDASGDTTYTANWGYNSSSQLSGNLLSLNATTSFSASGASQADGGPFPGLDLAYGDNLWYWKHARVGWELGFGWLPIDITSHSTVGAVVNQTTYQYDVSGLGVVPTAPYQGDPGGTGPLIPLQPASITSNSGIGGSVSGAHSLDVSLYSLRLGPSFYWDVNQHVGMSLGAGPAVGLVSGEYKYDEFITVNSVTAHNTGRVSGTSVVYGGYVNGTLMYHLVNNGDIYIGAQYMPMNNATISGGGREGTLRLNGQLYFSVGINWPF